jgi:hypothetical protein
LRDLVRNQPEEGYAPRVVGVDDWARKKGRAYGTITVDLEREVIDVLPDRSADETAAWLPPGQAWRSSRGTGAAFTPRERSVVPRKRVRWRIDST